MKSDMYMASVLLDALRFARSWRHVGFPPLVWLSTYIWFPTIWDVAFPAIFLVGTFLLIYHLRFTACPSFFILTLPWSTNAFSILIFSGLILVLLFVWLNFLVHFLFALRHFLFVLFWSLRRPLALGFDTFIFEFFVLFSLICFFARFGTICWLTSWLGTILSHLVRLRFIILGFGKSRFPFSCFRHFGLGVLRGRFSWIGGFGSHCVRLS